MAAFGQKEALASLYHPSLVCYQGPNPKTNRGEPTKIYAHPHLPKVIYPSGKFIVVRDIENAASDLVYRGHNALTTVAKFSPDGCWVASGDASGRVRIWAFDNQEHSLKKEVFVVQGEVRDLDWSPDGRHLAACGESQGQVARVFAVASGNPAGQVGLGHQRRGTAAAFRPGAPDNAAARVVTAAEDGKVIWHGGLPAKLLQTNHPHTNFVNAVAFSPAGDRAVSVGSDGKMFLYDGDSGDVIQEIPNDHTGSIYSMSWSPAGTEFVTSGADKTVRLWAASGQIVECVKTFVMSQDPQISDMQVGVVWCGAYIVSLSLAGELLILTPDAEAPICIMQNHQVAITAMAVDPAGGGRVHTGAYDGTVLRQRPFRGEGGLPAAAAAAHGPPSARLSSSAAGGGGGGGFNRAAHRGLVTGAVHAGGMLVTTGWDDMLRFSELFDTEDTAGQSVAEVALGGQPRCLAAAAAAAAAGAGPPLVAVAVGGDARPGVRVHRAAAPFEEVWGAALDHEPSAVALSPAGDEVVVGSKTGAVHAYALDLPGGGGGAAAAGGGGSPTPIGALPEGAHRAEITALAYSPDGALLAVGDASRAINVWERGSWAPKVKGFWVHHTARVNSLAWHPEGRLLASGALDSNVFIWSLDKPRKRVQYQFAHKDGVAAVGWLGPGHLVTAGADHCVCHWATEADAAEAFK